MSLLPVLRAWANIFSFWTAELWELRTVVAAAQKEGREGKLETTFCEYVRARFQVFAEHCEMVDLGSTREKARRMARHLSTDDTYAQLEQMVVDLIERLADDLAYRSFLYVPTNAVHFYDAPLHGWGDVGDRFPSVIYDIEEASKCLSLGRGTACVFHLMRVMESGLKAIAKPLGIPYAPSWESYLTQIKDKVTVKHRKKGIQWKRDEPLFKELAGDLESVKLAWRNPTMHIVRRYDTEEAEQVLAAARTFMRRIATRFSEEQR